MGQRLNIEILKGGKILANAYYHWSAYTLPALELCKGIIEEYKKIRVDPADTCDSDMYTECLKEKVQFCERFKEDRPTIARVKTAGEYDKKDEDVLLAIRLLESTGAGINESELKEIIKGRICQGITFRTAIDRNSGLISVTEKGIEETRCWQEGQATIDLDNKRILFGVFWTIDWKEYLEEFDINPEENPEQIPVAIENGIDIKDFSFEDVDAVIAMVKNTEKTNILVDSETVYAWVM